MLFTQHPPKKKKLACAVPLWRNKTAHTLWRVKHREQKHTQRCYWYIIIIILYRVHSVMWLGLCCHLLLRKKKKIQSGYLDYPKMHVIPTGTSIPHYDSAPLHKTQVVTMNDMIITLAICQPLSSK